MKDSIESGDFVVICTDKDRRGVFAGELVRRDVEAKTVVLRKARMCVYWSNSVRGVLGLAATGPNSGCRISSAPPLIELDGVTAVMLCSDAARDSWEAEPWSS